MFELNLPAVNVKSARFNVPLVNVNCPEVDEVMVNAEPNATTPPAPFWTIGPIVLAADVMVAVPLVLAKVHAPVPVVKVMPDTKVKLP